MSKILNAIESAQVRKDVPDFRAGDTVNVNVRVVEGNKERLQLYTGTVIQRRGAGMGQSFTVRKISGGVAVERIFPLHGHVVESIKVTRKGKVNRAKLYYLRELQGKAGRIKERT